MASRMNMVRRSFQAGLSNVFGSSTGMFTVNLAGQKIMEDELPEMTMRVHWGHKLEFMLSCVAFTVGLGNIWRFPYLCYKHGGGSFVLAYIILQATVGFPVYFMELALGQYAGKGPANVFDFNPVARGVGISMVVVCFIVVIYYNSIISMIVYYMFASMQPTLPWATCKPEWKDCVDDRSKLSKAIISICTKSSTSENNCTCSGNKDIDYNLGFECRNMTRHSTNFYFYDEVLNRADELFTITDFGLPSWRLTLCLLLSWIIVTCCALKGVKTSGKIVYFTATMPYVVLLILLVKAALGKGAQIGLKYLVKIKWEKFVDGEMWEDVAGQMMYSLGISSGGLITLSSYTHFYNNILSDALMTSAIDLFTSLLGTLVVIITLGQLAYNAGNDSLDGIAISDFGLSFVTYPEALSVLPASQFWSILFYFTLFLMAIDSEFTLFETIVSFLEDNFRIARRNNIKTRIGAAAICFILGLPCLTPGGIYLICTLDHYGASLSLIGLSTCEVVSIAWMYGAKQFLEDLEYMLGKKPPCLPYWYFTWVFWSPAVLLAITLDQWFHHSHHSTFKYFSGKDFSDGLVVLGWLVYVFIHLPIPLWAILYTRAIHNSHIFANKMQLLKKLIEPSPRWGPADGTHKLARQRVSFVNDILPNDQSQVERDPDSVATDVYIPCMDDDDLGDSETYSWSRTSDGKLLPIAVFDRARRAHSLSESIHRGSSAVDQSGMFRSLRGGSLGVDLSSSRGSFSFSSGKRGSTDYSSQKPSTSSSKKNSTFPGDDKLPATIREEEIE